MCINPWKSGCDLQVQTTENGLSMRFWHKKIAGQIVLKLTYDCGTPKGIRTPDLLVRSQTLYPTELRAR